MSATSGRASRLPEYDYSSGGAYFLTICAHKRQMLFDDPAVRAILEATWMQIPEHFPDVVPDIFVVMPNHFHAILMLNPVAVGSQHAGTLRLRRDGLDSGSVSVIVRSFKSAASRRLHQERRIQGPVWQSNYYDHVVRNERELDRVREYIAMNPSKWQFDSDNPERMQHDDYERAWSWLEASR